jgi:acetylcholinesterase
VGQLGVVSGYQATENNVLINIFKGIPFAQPPVGNLRFARPQPLTAFPSPIINATQPPNTCYSVNTATTPLNEDCLYLNIFAPNSPSADASGRAVMIWIYGGTFSSGSSANPTFDGRVLAAYGDVILVSINYRVGVLGFLYLNTTDVPGNVGLLDQQLAIQWVHDNIKYFGGDANRITVFGESAGAMSTGLQLLSPLNRGQFYLLSINIL